MPETAARRRAPTLVLTCEHAGNRIPREYAARFRGQQALLASHRGYDPGALPLARQLARALRVPLLWTPWSRLLCEANRSRHRPALWSRFTRDLPPAEQERLLRRYWWPHRRAVERAVAAAAARGRVVHVAVHSFTPVLDGEVRTADLGLLYDPARPLERAFAARWHAALAALAPDLRVRRNYPYRGTTDGLPTALRKVHAAGRYGGLELEVNQALLAGPPRRRLGGLLAQSLAAALGG